jgi:hypothetical protein
VSTYILIEQEPTRGQEHSWRPGATIGREGCDINLDDSQVSRRHAALRDSNGSPAIEDLGSTNGTFVNDRRITGIQVLEIGDRVRIGAVLWRLAAHKEATQLREQPAQPVQPAPSAAAPAAAEAGAAGAAVADPVAAVATPPRRGDVPEPPEVVPSAIRRVLPDPGPMATGFDPLTAPTRRRSSEATRLEATVVCMIVVALVALLVVIYFLTR